MQNCNVVYITGEWCSKQRERSFCYCWNLFVCNTAIASLFFSLPFKFVGVVFNRIVNNMFVFILCASVFLIWFSILIFALIIYIFFYFIFVEEVVSFTLYIRMMVELKNIYLTVVSSYIYKFIWNWKKYINK